MSPEELEAAIAKATVLLSATLARRFPDPCNCTIPQVKNLADALLAFSLFRIAELDKLEERKQ